MGYKGYRGAVEVDVDGRLLFGRVTGLRDVIAFQGATGAEVHKEFRASVDAYLAFCAARGEAPETPR